jgi:hypothetical protein
LAFSQIAFPFRQTRPENPDLLVSPCEAHGHDGTLDPAETEVALFPAAMIEVFSDHAQRVPKRMLGKLESDTMLGSIDPVFRSVPFEIGASVSHHLVCIPYHIFIWLKVLRRHRTGQNS